MKGFSALMRVVVACVLLGLAGSVGAQQSYPNKPIRFITPYVPGGTTTILARLVGEKLTESWGQQAIVENRPGGNTVIGTDVVAKSPPDGYTILLIATTHVIAPLLMATPYDAIKDFAAVATLAKTESVLVLNTSVSAKNLQEFIALAKARPGQLNYASAGSGTVTHLAGELFDIVAGTKTQHIPYKGAGQGLIDLIGGQVQLYFISSPAFVPHSKNPKLRAIAVTGETRLSALPQVPTFTEAGLSGYDVKSWLGVLAPAGTSKPIINKLSTEIGRFLAEPDFREKLVSQGVDPFVSSSEEFNSLLRTETVKWGKVIKEGNIKMEN